MASIRKLSNGRYQAQYRPIPGGKQITHTTRKKSDAQRWLDEQQALLVTGHYVDPGAGKITFAAYYNQWSIRQIWETGTKRGMDTAVASVTFSEVPLQLLRRSHIEEWIKTIESNRHGHSMGRIDQTRLAPGTIKTRFMQIRTILRAAVADKRISSDPSVGVKLPRGRRAEAAMRLPSIEDLRALLATADPTLRLFLTLCAFAGLRRGEAMALQIGDVDFTHQSLTVARQVQFYRRGKIEIRTPKYGSERKVSLPDTLTAMLHAHICSLPPAESTPESWIFKGKDGAPIHECSIATRWLQVKRAVKADWIRLHDLRHFFASGLIASGCDVVTVQRALGHSRPTMTLNTYAHLWPNSDDRTRSAANAMISKVLQSSDEYLTNAR